MLWRARALKAIKDNGEISIELTHLSVKTSGDDLMSPTDFNKPFRSYLLSNWEEISADVIKDMEFYAESTLETV